jgi:hypothetical protein
MGALNVHTPSSVLEGGYVERSRIHGDEAFTDTILHGLKVALAYPIYDEAVQRCQSGEVTERSEDSQLLLVVEERHVEAISLGSKHSTYDEVQMVVWGCVGRLAIGCRCGDA